MAVKERLIAAVACAETGSSATASGRGAMPPVPNARPSTHLKEAEAELRHCPCLLFHLQLGGKLQAFGFRAQNQRHDRDDGANDGVP